MFRPLPAAAVVWIALTGSAAAEPGATPDRIRGTLAKYQTERADAAKVFTPAELAPADKPVSYTHLTLPTIYSV